MDLTLTTKDLRKFGLFVGASLVGLFGLLLPYWKENALPIWPWLLAIMLWIPAVFFPNTLESLYKTWMKLGEALGYVNSRVILSFLFFFIITPIGLLRRTIGKDLMGKTYDPSLKSYRTLVPPKPITHMEKPF